MNAFNAIAAVLDALKTFPEPVQIPDALVDVEPLALAEARSRLQQIAQVATELRRLIDAELASKLEGKKGFRYGEDIYRPSNGRGLAKVSDPEAFWLLVAQAVQGIEYTEERATFLSALFPASSVRLTALPKLAEEVNVSAEALKDTLFAYDPPSSPLSVMPMSKAPKFLQDLEEGEIR